MEYITVVISCMLVIALSVFINERKILKLRKKNIELANLSIKIAIDGERVVANQRVLIEILEDNFTVEEIEEMIKKKLKNLEMPKSE